MTKKSFQFAWWVVVAIAIAMIYVAVLAGPLVPIYATILAVIALIKFLDTKGLVKEFTMKDFGLIMLIGTISVVTLLGLEILAFASVNIWTLLLIGIVLDIITVMLGSIPVIGDVMSAIVVAIVGIILTFLLVEGVFGGLIVGMAVIFAMLPGPIPLTTISLVGIKYFALVSQDFLLDNLKLYKILRWI